ncbi:MAG: formate dehydrogenase accessory sulfurtransferase FdhD [Fibrobacteria bacterium]
METLPALGAETVSALRIHAGEGSSVEDLLVAEGALQIRVNGAAYSVTMRTPGDDVMLAVGLLFTEGTIRTRQEILAWEEIPAAVEGEADTVDLAVADAALAGGKLSERRLLSNASCGVCGKVSADDLQAPSRLAPEALLTRLDLGLLPSLEGRMRSAQALFSRTGGCHAAALFDLHGNLLVLKEDVGRHNAVDKAVGHLLLLGLPGKPALLFISGRVSYEIVTKASKAGIPFLLAVSAPSSLAVKLCREAGVTLLAFVRGGKATVYTNPERVYWNAEGASALRPE